MKLFYFEFNHFRWSK